MFTKKSLKVYVLIIVQVLLQHHQSEAIKCYVCGDTNNFLLTTNDKKQSPPVSCTTLNDHWNNAKILEKYIIECPRDYNGCITQIQGDQVTRACDFFSLDDCQIANNVKYCYCSFDLCNGETDELLVTSDTNQVVQKLTSSTATQINYKDLIDDEDYNIEMSGNGNNDDNEDDNNNGELLNSTEKNIINLIHTTETISTILNNLPQITTETNNLIKNLTENETHLINEILIDEDEIFRTTTEVNRKYISTTIKYNNKNTSSSIKNSFNSLLLFVVAILYYKK